jgi:uncharacterized membrane protein YczE
MVIQNFNAPVGSVLTGPHSMAHVTQNFGAGASDVIVMAIAKSLGI